MKLTTGFRELLCRFRAWIRHGQVEIFVAAKSRQNLFAAALLILWLIIYLFFYFKHISYHK